MSYKLQNLILIFSAFWKAADVFTIQYGQHLFGLLSESVWEREATNGAGAVSQA